MLALAFISCSMFSLLLGAGCAIWMIKDEDKPKPQLKEPPMFDDTVQALLDTIEQHPDLWETAPSQRPEDTGYSLRSTKLGAALHATVTPDYGRRIANVAEGNRIIFSVLTHSYSDGNLDFQRWSAIHRVLAKHASRSFTDRVLKAVEGGAA